MKILLCLSSTLFIIALGIAIHYRTREKRWRSFSTPHRKDSKWIASVLSDPDQAKKYELAHDHLEYLEEMITQTEVELYVRIKPYFEFVEFVSAMPGMTELSSTIVLAETGVDMSAFDDSAHLCSWCGLVPANNESAGKKKSTRIAKAGEYLKPMMVQCALAAIKCKSYEPHKAAYKESQSLKGLAKLKYDKEHKQQQA